MAADPLSEVESGLAAVGVEYRERFSAAHAEPELRAVRAEILGKKGTLTRVLKAMGQLPAPERPRVGERVNAVRAEVETAFEQRLSEIKSALRKRELEGTPFDLSLPGRAPALRGHRHPVTMVRDGDLGHLPLPRIPRRMGARGRARGKQLHEACVPAGSSGN
ncbi:MAG: hypothetical protein QM784_26835 [Polyangiaceae bacterium]